MSDLYAGRFSEAQQLQAKGLFDEAADLFIEILKRNPDFIQAHVALQYLPPISNEKVGNVVDFYAELVRKDPNSSMNWGALGDFLTLQGHAVEAIPCYRRSCHLSIVKRRPQLETDNRSDKPSLPNLLICGFEKCATTSLYLYLRQHPKVIFGHKKEISFFNVHYALGLEWYLAHFPALANGSEFISGEATPSYITSREVERRIASLPQPPKIIMLVRDPVARTVSHYYHTARRGLERRTLAQAISDEMQTYAQNPGVDVLDLDIPYLLGSLYEIHLQRWRTVLSQERMLVMDSEDLLEHPACTMAKVYDFLGLPWYEITEFPLWNAGSYPKLAAGTGDALTRFFQAASVEASQYSKQAPLNT